MEDLAIAKSSVAKSSRYHHHHHVGDYDHVEDKMVMILMILSMIMTSLVSVYGNFIGPM